MPKKAVEPETLETPVKSGSKSKKTVTKSVSTPTDSQESIEVANEMIEATTTPSSEIDATLSAENEKAMLTAIYGSTKEREKLVSETTEMESVDNLEAGDDEDIDSDDYFEDMDEVLDENVSSEDEESMTDIIENFLHYYSQRKSAAAITRTQAKKLKKKPKILSAANGEVAVTPEERRTQELLVLQQAANSHSSSLKFLHGEIVGTRMMEGLNIPVAIVKLDDFDGFFEIIIPVSQLYPTYDIKKYIMEGGDIDKKAMLSMMKDRVGSKIEFEVVRVLPKESKAYASRINAMEKRAGHIFLGHGTKDGKPKIDPSNPDNKNLITGRVMKSGVAGVTVEVGGMESYIPINEVSYERIRNAADLYKPGDVVSVKVLSVTPYEKEINDRTYHFFEVESSIKQASKPKSEIYEQLYNEGDIRKGTVTGTSINGNYFVDISGQIEVVCPAPAYSSVVIGQDVQVSITRKTKINDVTCFYGHFART